MPQLIEHIDAIARRKQRDVLFIVFTEEFDGKPVLCNWRENMSRAFITEWLNASRCEGQEGLERLLE